MIDGLKFQMPSRELRTYLTERIEYHKNRLVFYEKQEAALREGQAEAPARYSGGNPIDALATKAREHANKVRVFQFMREHLVPDETYQLDETDLAKIEIIDRFF